MQRRSFLLALLGTTCLPFTALAANRKFVFKVKTKSGGIIGNVVIGEVRGEVGEVRVRL